MKMVLIVQGPFMLYKRLSRLRYTAPIVAAILMIGGLVAIATQKLRLSYSFHVVLTGGEAQIGGLLYLLFAVIILISWWRRLGREEHLKQMSNSDRKSLLHYKRRWENGMGDKEADWGCSDVYFEAAQDGTVTRQVVIYEDGSVLKYDPDRIQDRFGALSRMPLETAEYSPFRISSEDFESAWNSVSRYHCQ
jgi:hypothetical protein